MMNLLDLFSGIGGFSLGLERSGRFKTVAFCENDKFCQSILKRHWPDVPCYKDVVKLSASEITVPIHAMCGGFPCQDVSSAGKRKGIEGARSSLWKHFARLISEIRPEIVFVENVADLCLADRGLSVVLGDLAEIGYDVEWHCIQAADLGASHIRDRIWIMAYPNGKPNQRAEHPIHQNGAKIAPERQNVRRVTRRNRSVTRGANVSDPNGGKQHDVAVNAEVARGSKSSADAHGAGPSQRQSITQNSIASRLASIIASHRWIAEPEMGRMVDGFPGRVDSIRALGNAVVPQIPEALGRAYVAWRRAAQ